MMLASATGSAQLVSMLVRGGADAAILDKQGRSALEYVHGLCGPAERFECMRVLLKAGAPASSCGVLPKYAPAGVWDAWATAMAAEEVADPASPTLKTEALIAVCASCGKALHDVDIAALASGVRGQHCQGGSFLLSRCCFSVPVEKVELLRAVVEEEASSAAELRCKEIFYGMNGTKS